MENEEEFIHSLTYADISRALSRDFFRVFCVNTDTDVFVEYDADKEDESLDIHMRGDDFRKVAKRLTESSYSEDLDMVRTAFTKENIQRVLSVDSSFSLNYRMMINKKATYVRLKAVRVRENDPIYILIALSDTDAHMQRLAIYERTISKSLTYAGIAEALASDHFCIYYVNSVSGEYIEYKSSDEYKKLGLPEGGTDFFESCRTDLIRLIWEEDRDTFLQAFDRDNLTRVLSVDRSFLLTFRIMLDGRPNYIRMKATRMAAEDDHHIVVGLSNIDASMQRNEQYLRMQEIANRDSLTGVKSKHAYTTEEEIINHEIEAGVQEEFAVAVCDVNGLKQINDTLGHKAGDQYIQDACSVICGIFCHSPVYRIGGDEFAVLLRGNDYEERADLLSRLNRRVEENRNEGGVVISAGMADYLAGKDTELSSVFDRADQLMYRRKAQLKSSI